jgi:hypothetical protein
LAIALAGLTRQSKRPLVVLTWTGERRFGASLRPCTPLGGGLYKSLEIAPGSRMALHPKVSSSVVAGAVMSILLGEANRRGITIAPDEAAGLSTLIALLAAYYTSSGDDGLSAPVLPLDVPQPLRSPPPAPGGNMRAPASLGEPAVVSPTPANPASSPAS